MRRRFEEAADSLELVLGCMWDNFGNIILIALLVTILARESSNVNPVSSTPATQRDAARAQEALALAKAVALDLSEKSADPALADRLKWLEQRQRLRQEADRQQERIRAVTEQLGNVGARTSVVDIVRTAQTELAARQQVLTAERGETDRLKLAIEAQKKRVQDKQRELLAASDQRVRRLRLPREHATSKTHFYLIVRYGRLYPLYIFRNGDPERNTTSVRWTEESPGSKRVEALADKGIVVTEEAGLAPFFRQFPADNLYLVFQVYEDSFAAFNTAKAAAVAQRFEYTWEPRKRDEVLRLGAAARPPPPQ